MEGFIKSLMMISLMTILASCGGGGGGGSDDDDELELSNEAKSLMAASENLEASASEEGGLANYNTPNTFIHFSNLFKGSNFSLTQNKEFDPDAECRNSGTYDNDNHGVDGWPLYSIYCNLMKRPDGPDTVRGAIDRAAGWLCALGKITYDSKARTVTMKITDKCFSAGFVEMVQQEIGTTSFKATVKGFKSVTGVAPAEFDKYFTFSAGLTNEEKVDYTFAVKETTNERAIAVLGSINGNDTGDAFSVYMNKSTGVMKVEGRFSPEAADQSCETDVNCRHNRFYMQGQLSSNFEIENVDELHFLNAEESFYFSISGTPSVGRILTFKESGDSYGSDPGINDGACYGEEAADCSGSTAIEVTDNNFVFAGTYETDWTSANTWFKESSYLGNTANIITESDIWGEVK